MRIIFKSVESFHQILDFCETHKKAAIVTTFDTGVLRVHSAHATRRMAHHAAVGNGVSKFSLETRKSPSANEQGGFNTIIKCASEALKMLPIGANKLPLRLEVGRICYSEQTVIIYPTSNPAIDMLAKQVFGDYFGFIKPEQQHALDLLTYNGEQRLTVARGANLRGAKLQGANLRGADFSGVDCTQANFKGANLAMASFQRAELDEVVFDKARLVGTDFYSVNLSKVSAHDANFYRANFMKTRVTDSSFRGSDFGEVDFEDAMFSSCDLESVKITAKYMPRAMFVRCSFTKAEFTDAPNFTIYQYQTILPRGDNTGNGNYPFMLFLGWVGKKRHLLLLTKFFFGNPIEFLEDHIYRCSFDSSHRGLIRAVINEVVAHWLVNPALGD